MPIKDRHIPFCFKSLNLVDSDRCQLWPNGTSAPENRSWLSLDASNEESASLMELVPDLTTDVEEAACLKEYIPFIGI